MSEKKVNEIEQDVVGEIKISADVITVIAHTVASEIEGVAGMNPNLSENISSVLGR